MRRAVARRSAALVGTPQRRQEPLGWLMLASQLSLMTGSVVFSVWTGRDPLYPALFPNVALLLLAFLLRTLAVERKQTSQYLITDFIGPAVAPRLLALAGASRLFFVFAVFVFVVEQELALGLQVRPSVRRQHCTVHRIVERP